MAHSPSPPLREKRASIGIVDSEASCRIGITHHINKIARWDVVWASSTAEEALEKMAKEEPDLLILEIKLPGKDGLEFIKYLMPFYPNLKILVYSSHSEEFYAERCLKAGAVGYLHKMDPMGKLQGAVEKILRGELYLTPRIALQTIRSISKQSGGNQKVHFDQLTDRELEVMILLAQGNSCQDSAEKLGISHRTIQVHRNNVRLKLGLETSLQLHAYAIRFYGEGVENPSGNLPPTAG
jgi:DNA-binding NarL/FixJ family response regulator